MPRSTNHGLVLLRPLALAGAIAALVTTAVLLYASLGKPTSTVEAQTSEQCESLLFDFAGLPHGTILGEQFASAGIHISGDALQSSQPDALVVFDSNLPKSGTVSDDLKVGIGNLAIIPNNLDGGDSDGIVDNPRESFAGGTQIYTFDHDRIVTDFVIVDIDHGDPSSHKATAFDADNNVIVSVPIPIGSDATFQTITMNAVGVRRLEIFYNDSGGVTDIDLRCEESTPTPTSTPTATSTAAPTLTATTTATPTPALTPAVLAAVQLPTAGGLPPSEGDDSLAPLLYALLAGAAAIVVGAIAVGRRRLSAISTRVIGSRGGHDSGWTWWSGSGA